MENEFRDDFKGHEILAQEITINKGKDFKSIHKSFKSKQVGWIDYYGFEIPPTSFHLNATYGIYNSAIEYLLHVTNLI